MFITEMFTKVIHRIIVLVFAVGITVMTEQMIATQMSEQLVAVHEPGITKLAQGVAPVGGVVRVALPPVVPQLLLRVAAPLEAEDLQVLHAEVAVDQVVLAPHVVLELLERVEDAPAVAASFGAEGAPELEELLVRFFDVFGAEDQAVFAVLEVGGLEGGEERTEGGYFFSENDLQREVTVVLKTESIVRLHFLKQKNFNMFF